jgi:hypothetical protein
MVGQAATAIPTSEPVSAKKVIAELDASDSSQVNGAHCQKHDSITSTAEQVQQKYEEERRKRLRPDGDGQYVVISASEKFKHYNEDPWLSERSRAVTTKNGDHVKFLILGAGCGGVLYAVKLIKAGVPASDIRIVDSAGGFGGTYVFLATKASTTVPDELTLCTCRWYYNRYPGLMCDVESYCYLPLLEETGYIPKHKYSYGKEIREYIESITEKYGIATTAMFQTKINSLAWDEKDSQWVVKMTKERDAGLSMDINVTAEFIIPTS